MRRSLVVLLLLCLQCAHAQKPLRDVEAPATDAAAALAAEVRFTYFGGGERFRGSASLLLRRPAAVRLDVRGPHGGILASLASDGTTVTACDLGQGRCRRGSATASSYAALLGLQESLPLSPECLVAIMLGATDWPSGRRWTRSAWTFAAELAPDGTLERLVATRATPAAQIDVVVSERHADSGVPLRLLAHLGTDAQLSLRLRDVEIEPPLTAADFALVPAPPLRVEPIGAEGP